VLVRGVVPRFVDNALAFLKFAGEEARLALCGGRGVYTVYYAAMDWDGEFRH